MGVWTPFRSRYVTIDLPADPQAALRQMLRYFPDRAAYEAWCAARDLSDDERAHMEGFLPAALQAKGTV